MYHSRFTGTHFEFDNKCTCFAVRKDKKIIFGRNSDFIIELEHLYDSCYYKIKNSYSFIGNTTAFTEIDRNRRMKIKFIVLKEIL